MIKITKRQFEIIEAASRILTISGVSGLTIKNLAKEMEFSESAIYRHFTSKEEIIIALLAYLAEEMDDRFSKAISEDQSAIAKFQSLFKNHFLFFEKNPHFVVAVFSDGLMEESQRVNQIISKIMAVMMKHLMPIILEGQQKDVFTNHIPADEMIHIVMGAIRLQMFKWRVSNFQFHIMEKGDKMIESILTLIKTK